MSTSHLSPQSEPVSKASEFPLDTWYVAAQSKELSDKPLARTLLNQPVVLFRTADGKVNALVDRCCHRQLPLSCGTIEAKGLRCGYHGLLFDGIGKCIEIPGQEKIPRKAQVGAFHVVEQDELVWIWFGADTTKEPLTSPPRYPYHSEPGFVFDGDVYHYNAPYQLVHDNLLDLSHLGYVHLHTIGGDANTHMNAQMDVTTEGDSVKVVRYMRNSTPPPTYTAAYPFKDKIDRWQQIEFFVSHLRIWTGAVDVNTDAVDDPNRGGFHMRGLHCVTPETSESCHYFWTMATNPSTNIEETKAKVVDQTRFTFDEDKIVIEAQFKNMQKFDDQSMIDIHVDTGANQARRIIKRLCEGETL
ncbi:aromatic ring-hydroxylating dioxygenase subunit alpha [Paraglaciecola sp.]|uniref:aromatic ring-hydroxylating dioxygenase subunit alpha n=1 Tax=Paraglaciecola sp. TaxID=1920173 RepID=UPI00273D073D|nr:aromatic ring-hydroxylating dioxygenase subunit alpha [Paraglaciecola sp.]MDP5029213.1 aromatic ring-hydroxylating dioxygenase subunit alpha [Paraglaciecola sp.]